MADTKVRVLISLHQGGGAGSVNSILRLALGVAGRGVHVRFVCPPDSPVESEARQGGLEVHPIALARGGRFSNARHLADLLARHPVDLVNSHGSKDREAFTWLGLTARLRVPVIFTRRSWPRTSRLENWLAGRVARFVVTLSEPVAQRLGATGIPVSKLRVIENGVLLDRLDRPVGPAEVDEWRGRIGWEPSRRTIAIAARPKDQEEVVRGLERVTTPVRLVLAGLDGEALQGPLPAVPARHAVVRLPFLSDVRPLYELVEVVLHPSRWDALPQAVLEAMALGKPVIASRATGNAVIITDEQDGLLVEPSEPDAWARALERLLGNPALAARLGAAARRRAREDFPLEQTITRTVALYHECLGRSS
jgi:glycosyltransferase involved in cell wall biosynthesis